ncbi:LamG-like jellyroll fold domain-containing protein [Streptomyces sp. NPDC059874]|uniref:LamG-like jellyroll fold domain-containing protein n=1 Tax=Streptomyces sp. NPDC059874 TaxID=3346983 RepID=UPI00365F7A14
MTDGTNPSSNPQPEPAPGSGGYGFPPGPPAQGGYGFPPNAPGQDGGYGYPQGGGYGYPPNAPAGGGFGPPPVFPQDPGPVGPDQGLPGIPSVEQPDWEAMADRSAAERRKKRLWMVGGAVAVLLLLAGGGTFMLLKGDNAEDDGSKDVAENVQPSSSPKPGASPTKTYSPTLAEDPSQLRDSVGKVHIRMGNDASVPKVGTRHELRLKGNPESYAQATKAAVDTEKGFTLTARVHNSSGAKGPHIAVSQGTGESFAFELGADEVNGKQAWVFRVRTSDKSEKPTLVTVAAEGLKTVKTTTSLLATYDAEKKTIALYVEGKKAAEAPVPGIWKNSGPLQLGRSRHANAWAGDWQGAIKSVRVYEVGFSAELAAAYQAGTLDDATKAKCIHGWIVG